MAKGIKGIIVEIGGDTSALEKALSSVNSKTGSLSKELKGINSLLKLDPSNAELLNQKQTVLNSSIEATQDKLNQLKKIKEEADKKMSEGTKISEENYRDLQREIANTQNKLNSLTQDLKQFNLENSKWTQKGKQIEEYGNKISSVSKKVDSLGNKASITSGAVAAGGAILANSAMTLEDAVAKYVSTTNTAQEETEKYKRVLENINKNNYGEGYEDIAEAMSNVTMQIKGLDEASLQNITEKAIAFRDLFGYDVSESIRSVKTLMGEFNISADEAFNLLAEGKKQGLDFSNELLDNVNEYSVQFNKLGLSAEDMFNIFKTGTENGAFNLDKIGNAVKEFSIRAIDGSNTTIDGFKRLGLNADEMAKKFANGGEEAKKAFIEVVKRLGKMDNKVSQSIAGVDLFGTMWEDLGPDVILSFSQMDKGISKSSNSMQKSIDELYNTTKKKAETQLKRLQSLGAEFGEEMLPVLEDLIDMAEGFIEKLEGMSDEQKANILKLGMFVAAAGPVIKTVGTLGQGVGAVTKGVGIFSQAIGVATNKTTSSEKSVNDLAKVLQGLSSPAGLAAIGVTAATGIILTQMQNAEKETKEAFSNMSNGAESFIQGLDNAESHLASFNSTLFVSSEEQQKLQEDMQNIQRGITNICKTASDERRGYTQQEIIQLDQYFTKLRDLNQREVEIQQSIATAITQQAVTNAETMQGTLEEYQTQAEEYIKTAQEQKDKTVEIIKNGTIEQIALLNQRYNTEESRRTEEYQNEYNAIISQQQQKIDAANQEVAKVTQIYANGYLERSKQNNGFYSKIEEYNAKVEQENNRHNAKIDEINNNATLNGQAKMQLTEEARREHSKNLNTIWNDMYKNMNESQLNELGVWMALLSQSEVYGGKIDEDTQEMADSIIESFDNIPIETKDTMKDVMEKMMKDMKNEEPSLFSKASSIANGIISRLKRTFNITAPEVSGTEQLPGHKSGLDYVPYDNYVARLHKGERVLTAKENKQLMTVQKLSKTGGFDLKGLANNITNKNNFFFNMQINPKSLTERDMKMCFDFWEKEAGKYI